MALQESLPRPSNPSNILLSNENNLGKKEKCGKEVEKRNKGEIYWSNFLDDDKKMCEECNICEGIQGNVFSWAYALETSK